MTRPNYERNQLFERYWREGKTVDEAAEISGVARATVGYYYRKFNRYARMGLDLHIPAPKPQTPTEAYVSLFFKVHDLSRLIESLKNDSPQTCYYKLASFKLMADLSKYFQPSPEEKKQVNQLMLDWIVAIASQSQAPA